MVEIIILCAVIFTALISGTICIMLAKINDMLASYNFLFDNLLHWQLEEIKKINEALKDNNNIIIHALADIKKSEDTNGNSN